MTASVGRRRATLAPAAASVAIVRVLALVLQGATLVALAHALGPGGFGVFSLVLVVQSLIAVVSNLGVFTSTQYHAGRRVVDVQRVAAASLVVTVVGSLVLVPPSGFVLSWLYQAVLSDLPFDLFVIGVMAGPIRLASEAMLGVFIGTGDVRAQSALAVVGPASFFAIVAVLALTIGISLPAAVFAWLASQIAVLGLSLFEFRRHGGLGAPAQVVADAGIWSGVARLGAGAYATYVAYWITTRLDRVALNVVGGAYAVGIFSLAAWVAESFALLPTAVGAVIFPRLAADPESGGSRYLPLASRAVVGTSFAIAVPMVLALAALSSVLGGTLRLAIPVLILILPGYILFGLFGIFTSYWMAHGRTGIPAVFYLAAAGGRVLATLLLYPRLGLLGVALAMTVVGSAAALVAAASIARRSGVPVASIFVPRIADLRAAAATPQMLVSQLRASGRT